MDPVFWKDRVRRAACEPLTWGVAGSAALVLACCIFFLWSADKGIDLADEAYYILVGARPHDFPSLTEFGAIWHPVYVLAGGNLIVFRLLGLLVLQACGLVFSLALARFVRPSLPDTRAAWIIVLAIGAVLFWEYDNWLPTPNYNGLNLCGLMLFLAGLTFAGAWRAEPPPRKAITLFAMLSGLGICVMMWCKPPSAALAVAAGIGWMLASGRKRALLALSVAAATALAVYGFSIFLIDGSLHGFLVRKAAAMENVRLVGGGHDMKGMVRSVVSPFLPSAAHKQAGAVLAGLVLFVPALIWAAVMRFSKGGARYGVVIGCALILATATAIFRGWDFAPNVTTTDFHVWHIVLLICAICIAVAVREVRRGGRPTVFLAAILFVSPAIYSIGTGNTVLWHMSSASVFWVAAAMVAVSAAPSAQRASLLSMTGLLCGLVTLGMLDGVAQATIFRGPSLWQQTEPVMIGLSDTRLLLDPQTADALIAMQDAARRHGFHRGMPILDLSGEGPGVVVVLGGQAVGSPWLLHSQDGDPMVFVRHALDAASRRQLCHAWLVTEGVAATELERQTFVRSGLDFPARYKKIVTPSRPDAALHHALWKPRDGDGCRS